MSYARIDRVRAKLKESSPDSNQIYAPMALGLRRANPPGIDRGDWRVLLSGLLACDACFPASAQSYSIDWHRIAGGGASSNEVA